MKTVARIENLSIIKNNHILQSTISFNWNQGEQWCVTGPTGSGKTTFLKTLAGLIYPKTGDIKFPILEDIRRNTEAKILISDMIAFVPQEIKIPSGFIQDLYYQRRYQAAEQDEIPTTFDVLMSVAKEDKDLVEHAAKQMNLTKHFDQAFVQLSNGQTRRLMIAIALLKKPKLLLLDNPYTGLDKSARMSLNKQLNQLIKNGVHIFIAAHEHELETMKFVTNILQLNALMPNFTRKHEYPFDQSVKQSEEKIIEMNNIKVAYGKRVVLNVNSWEVKAGEHWVIQGANGSGKSTLLALIIADHPQVYANDIQIFGKKRGSGESIWDIKKRMGYFSPELLRYYSKLPTAEQVIATGWNNIIGQIKTINSEQKKKVLELAKWLGIDSLLDIRFGDLSLGQQKMVLIARAMIREPEVLILDEPLQGMDAECRDHFKLKIAQFSINRTVLYVTHDEEEIPIGKWKKLLLKENL